MAFLKPEAIDGYQPPVRLVHMEDPGLYVAVMPSQDHARDMGSRFLACRMDDDEGVSEMEVLGGYPSINRAFGMIERTAYDRKQEYGAPRMGM
jgi:hypothetical protein